MKFKEGDVIGFKEKGWEKWKGKIVKQGPYLYCDFASHRDGSIPTYFNHYFIIEKETFDDNRYYKIQPIFYCIQKDLS